MKGNGVLQATTCVIYEIILIEMRGERRGEEVTDTPIIILVFRLPLVGIAIFQQTVY